ncbi:hypothetical protein [Sulfurimonas sp.]|uniref:hypothetical protein n=1 Tax=Sulfurimonas sp. TaxID=2022749 RepID=UPI00356255E9
MKELKIYVYIVLSAIFLVSCSNKNLDIDVKNNITSIEIDNNISGSIYPFFMSKNNDKVEKYGNEKASKRLALYLERNNIDIKKNYQKELKKALDNNDFFKEKIVKNGDYVLASTIEMYGLIYPHIYNDNYKPIVRIKIDMINKKTQELVWSDSCHISILNSETMSRPFHEYINNPRILEKAFSEVMQIAISEIISDI